MTSDYRPETRSPQSTTERLGLAEMQVVFDQMHARMNIIAQIMNFSVALAAAIIAAAVALPALRGSAWAFLLFPFAFDLFAFLILREDFLMASHDRYWYQLRDRLARASGATPEDLAFLAFIKSWKVRHVFTILSGLRYIVPMAAAGASTLWALGRLDAAHCVGQVTLASVNGAVILVIVSAVVLLGRLHSENERERLRLEQELRSTGNETA